MKSVNRKCQKRNHSLLVKKAKRGMSIKNWTETVVLKLNNNKDIIFVTTQKFVKLMQHSSISIQVLEAMRHLLK